MHGIRGNVELSVTKIAMLIGKGEASPQRY